MSNQKQLLHPLELKYDQLGRKQQKYFREAWLLVTGNSRQNLKNRLQRPYLIDLAIWQRVFNELLLKDEIFNHYKPILKEHQILPFENQADLFPTPKA